MTEWKKLLAKGDVAQCSLLALFLFNFQVFKKSMSCNSQSLMDLRWTLPIIVEIAVLMLRSSVSLQEYNDFIFKANRAQTIKIDSNTDSSKSKLISYS